MTQQYPIIVIEGDVDDDGSPETGIFELPDTDVTASSLTEYLAQIGGGGGVVGALTAQVGAKGSQISIDGGAGPRTFQLQFEAWPDSTYQFGDSASSGLSQSSATGQDRQSQADVLNEYINRIDIGSNNPAELHLWEHSDGSSGATAGVYGEPFKIAIPESSITVSTSESTLYEGELTCVVSDDLTDIIDGADRTG
jgi:hypothetical protein